MQEYELMYNGEMLTGMVISDAQMWVKFEHADNPGVQMEITLDISSFSDRIFGEFHKCVGEARREDE